VKNNFLFNKHILYALYLYLILRVINVMTYLQRKLKYHYISNAIRYSLLYVYEPARLILVLFENIHRYIRIPLDS